MFYEGGVFGVSAIFQYLVCVIASALLGSLVQQIAPPGTAGRVAKLACGLLVMLCMISPVLRLDSGKIAAWISELELQKDAAFTGIEVQTKDLQADIISDKVEAYVLDKAESLGLQIEAEVSMNTEGTYPYPDGITIRGAFTQGQKALLQSYIEENFAIPEDRQVYLP